MESVLEFKHISKYFPGVKALDDICFKAYGGEVLAFLGENGAGKSTLLKVLNGDYKPDAGEYLLNGEQKHFQMCIRDRPKARAKSLLEPVGM